MAYRITLSDGAEEDLRALTARERAIIDAAIDEQLMHEPHVITRNRKKLRGNPIADWEVRVGEFRIFYDIDPTAATVKIAAVGRKVHNRLWIGGEEFSL